MFTEESKHVWLSVCASSQKTSVHQLSRAALLVVLAVPIRCIVPMKQQRSSINLQVLAVAALTNVAGI
jgi:hypothetical protein